MIIKIKRLTDTARLPTKGSDGAVGYDLYADSDKEITIYPHTSEMIYSGIAMEIPEGYGGFIYPRSGLSTKQGIRLANCVGVIDSDYRGEIGLPMHNDSDKIRVIKPFERVAQIVIHKCENIIFTESYNLSITKRGDGGFGSTGI